MPIEEVKKLKTLIIAGISVTCLLTLYILTSPSPVIENRVSERRENVDVLYQDYPQVNNLCTTDSFNSGEWVHQSIGLESHSVEGLSSFAGYHCNWDFAHRCYMRSDPVSEFNRSKAL